MLAVRQDLGADLDEVAGELARIPLGEDRGHLLVGLTCHAAQIAVGISNELHIAVLDAVVHHLDEVPRAACADPGTAGRAVLGLSGDLGEDRLDAGPGFLSSAGHDGGAIERALFAARDTTADEVNAVTAQLCLAALGVLPVGVAPVDDDVASLEVGQQRLDDVVYGLARADHHHDLAWTLEGGDEVPKVGEAEEVLASTSALHEVRDDLGLGALSAIVYGDLESITLHVEREVLTHYR